MSDSFRPISLPAGLRGGHQRFPLGTVTASESALAFLAQTGNSIEELLSRHVSGKDYGDEHEESALSNEESILRQSFVCSVYTLWRKLPHLGRDKIWITTCLREGWTSVTLIEDAGHFI
jgi:hypothetical protein